MFVGRKKEQEILNNAMKDDASHFIAVYGRRRVGKTFLIRETLGNRFTFQHVGIYGGSMREQLQAFRGSLKEAGHHMEHPPTDWIEAFEELKDVIRNSNEKRKVIFIDELSWMDTQKSRMMPALENFWNGFASARKDVVLIVCASATSWMLSKVVHNKGGLYNRLTEQIALQAFSLNECEEFVGESGLALNRDQIVEMYMIFGGIPYYWSFLKKGMSLPQNIDSMLFIKDAPLKDEYKYLYASVFKKPETYVRIIETLATKKAGMTRTELIDKSGIVNSGDLSTKLEELESCGFIRKYTAFNMKKKNAVYQLIDCFTLFHFQFLEKKPTDENFWSNQINTPSVNSWKGLAFERVCMNHEAQIKRKLGISGVLTDVCSWYVKKDSEKGIFGSQIDMLIVRNDRVINLCEMKYSDSEYHVTDKDVKSLKRKVSDLKNATGTRYAIYPTLVTTYGAVENSYSGSFQSVITMDDLF